MVSQYYESQVYDEYVIKGNAAVLKCNIPSFVSDHVEITEWVDSNGSHYTRDEDNSGKFKANSCFIVSLSLQNIVFKSMISTLAEVQFHFLHFPFSFDQKMQ